MNETVNYLVDIELTDSCLSSMQLGVRIFKKFLGKSDIRDQINDIVSNFFKLNDDLGFGKLNEIGKSIVAIKKVSKDFFEKNNIYPLSVVGHPDSKDGQKKMLSGNHHSFEVVFPTLRVNRNIDGTNID